MYWIHSIYRICRSKRLLESYRTIYFYEGGAKVTEHRGTMQYCVSTRYRYEDKNKSPDSHGFWRALDHRMIRKITETPQNQKIFFKWFFCSRKSDWPKSVMKRPWGVNRASQSASWCILFWSTKQSIEKLSVRSMWGVVPLVGDRYLLHMANGMSFFHVFYGQ